MPGVSIRQAPVGSGISARWVVVWRPRASDSRTSPVFIRSMPSSVLVRVDLPAPELPTSTAVRPGLSHGFNAATLSGSRALTARTAMSCAASSTSAASEPGTSSTWSDLVSTTTGSAPLPCTSSR